jgi:hypothetical protein
MDWTSYVQIDNDELRFGLKRGDVCCWEMDGRNGKVLFDCYEPHIRGTIGICWMDANGLPEGTTWVNVDGKRTGRETWSKKV